METLELIQALPPELREKNLYRVYYNKTLAAKNARLGRSSRRNPQTYLLTAHHAYVAHRAATKFLQPCLSLASFSMVLQL